MLNITPEEQAIWQSSALKNLTLVFSDGTILDNNDICAESMEFEQTIADGTMTLFGSVFASTFRVRVFDNGDGYAGLKVNPMLNIVSEDENSYLTKGIHNLIPYPYYDTTKTSNGITWTDNGDGTVTANGTPTATSYFNLWGRVRGKFPNIVAGQRYVLSLEVQNGTCSIYFSHVVGATNIGEFAVRNVSDRYAEVEFTAWEDEYDANNLALYISKSYGQQVNTIIKPMLRLASDDGTDVLTDKSGNKLTVKSGTYTKRLGNFTVISDKLSADGIYRELVCYDDLYTVLQTDYSGWHNSLSYPITVKGYREAFFEHIGIREERNVSLINDSMYVNKNPSTQLSGASILGSIMAINAVWGYIGWDGRFHYIVPKTTADIVINDNSYVQGSCAFEEYVTQEFTKVSFNISAETSEGTVDNTIDVGTDGGNTLTITDNCLMFNKTQADCQTIGNNILTQLDGFSYRPTTVQFPPYMGLELGDTFTINTNNSRSTTFPVLSRRLTGISALRDTFSAEGAELLHENANSLVKKLAQVASGVSGANLAANSALTRVSTVDEVVDILGWVGDYGEYEATSDTEVVNGKYYFTKDSEQTVEPVENTRMLLASPTLRASATEPTATGYTYVENPTGNPAENGYYELSGVSSGVSKYLKTHLKMESDGLYVLLDDSGFRLRITNTAVQVINENGTVVGEYSTATTIGDSENNHVYIDNDSIDIMKSDDMIASFGTYMNSNLTYSVLMFDENTGYVPMISFDKPTDVMPVRKIISASEEDMGDVTETISISVDPRTYGDRDNFAKIQLEASGINGSTYFNVTDSGIDVMSESFKIGQVDYVLSNPTISLWESILGS